MLKRIHPPIPDRERGAVLLVGLIILAILMIGATSIMNTTITDERMAGNSKTHTEAFFAAEAGRQALVNHITAAELDDSTPADKAKKSLKARENWNRIYDDIEAKWHNSKRPHKINGFADVQFSNNGNGTPSSYSITAEPVLDKDGKIIENRLRFASVGTTGAASRTIGFDLDAGGSGLPPAPAAISCFGGPCYVRAGAANKAPISGLDHPLPPQNCHGNNNCGTSGNQYSKNNVPAVYLSDFENSIIDVQGGSNKGDNGKGKNDKNGNGNSGKPSFEGVDRTTADTENSYSQITSTGKTKEDNGSIWGQHHYPDPSTAPKNSEYAGPNATKLKQIYNAAETASDNFNDPITVINTNTYSGEFPIGGNHHGVVIIEGKKPNQTNTIGTDKGNGYFAGLIILKDCNSLSFSGTPFVYGAIIVDATDCPDDYKPFVGSGNPEVLYSQEALDNAGLGLGLNGDMKDWYEVIN